MLFITKKTSKNKKIAARVIFKYKQIKCNKIYIITSFMDSIHWLRTDLICGIGIMYIMDLVFTHVKPTYCERITIAVIIHIFHFIDYQIWVCALMQ